MSQPRSDILGEFSLATEIERFVPAAHTAGRRAETLIKDATLRVVLVTMQAGAHLKEHTAPGPITIQVLQGEFVVTVRDIDRTLATGDLIALTSGTPHAVNAIAAGAFLLTIGMNDRHQDLPAAMA